MLAWKVILGDQGVDQQVPLLDRDLRRTEHPLSFLLYSRFAVMLVLGYVWLPFVALPIFVTLESLDRRLLEAASDLGASRLQAFRRVTLPLSLPGVVAAFLFVFIPTVGEFVTPSLVGGSSGYMYGNQIHDLFNGGFPDWQTGATLSLFLLGVIAALTFVFVRFLRLGEASCGLMDVALSANGRRIIRVFFALVLVFLYAPIAILLIFSFNKASVPTFPLTGFTFRWYHEFATNGGMQGGARDERDRRRDLERRSRSRSASSPRSGSRAGRSGARGVVTAFLLTPLVIPFIVLGISLLLLYHELGIPLSILTVTIGHVVISLPYTILVLLPRLAADRSLPRRGGL